MQYNETEGTGPLLAQTLTLETITRPVKEPRQHPEQTQGHVLNVVVGATRPANALSINLLQRPPEEINPQMQ